VPTEISTDKPKALLSWSSGKDSAFALYEILRSKAFEVVGLLTTVTDDFKRVSMHGVREALLDRQAEEMGLPLYKIRIPYPCTNEVYEKKMKEFLTAFQKRNSPRHFRRSFFGRSPQLSCEKFGEASDGGSFSPLALRYKKTGDGDD